ncbi:DeoR/GlpR family DNA-binding transcription regulator [Ectobacillus panaciterrae]|uniref:DeoR/GlpR family DNA-binding transcription regulator n=1 Tax=Ectobacillus panaciterrae TaxID=363872 RepID=UPI00041F36D2|nr:DeoR/GlpR family DNA-binding transcription regulator [Ectobacillus panaciterrae]
MLTPERHQIILDLVKRKGIVKLQELMDATGSSESTIRRDLIQLEDENHLKRVHGGASSLQSKGTELSMNEKSSKNLHEKNIIGQYAASLVEDGDCIYLDAGSTTYEMIPYLQGKDITVVTNGLMHIEALFQANIRAYLLGGMMKSNTRALIGSAALEGLLRYRFDLCFLGANGIHATYGYTTPDPEEALLKKTALQLSNTSYVLADGSKFSEVSFAKIEELGAASIITANIEESERASYANKTKIKVVTA